MYELLVIGRTEDSDQLFAKLEKMVAAVQATAVDAQKLGKKILAYPLAKQTEAEYFLFNFEAPPESVAAISGNLRLEQETVLRYLITRVKERKSAKRAKSKTVTEEVKSPKEEKETEKPSARAKKTVKLAAKPAKVKGKASKK